MKRPNFPYYLFSISLATFLFSLSHCGSKSSNQPRMETSLVDHDAWALVEEELTHLFPEKREEHECEQEGYKPEFLGGSYVFSVLTQFCNYIVVNQKTLEDIQEGDTLKIRFWHSQLTAPFDSLAITSIVLDEEEIWREEFRIPLLKSELSKSEWKAPRDIPAGTSIYFHVNNHGNNEYSIVEILLSPAS